MKADPLVCEHPYTSIQHSIKPEVWGGTLRPFCPRCQTWLSWAAYHKIKRLHAARQIVMGGEGDRE